MKILYVIHNFLPWSIAGSEVYTYNLARALGDRHDVRVFTREPGMKYENFTSRDLVYEGVRVRTVKYNIHPISHPLEPYAAQLSSKPLEKLFGDFLDEFQPDLVHFQHTMHLSPSLIAVAKQRGLPVVHHLHDYWYMCRQVQLLTLDDRICSGPESGMKCRQCLSNRFVRVPGLGGLFRLLGGGFYVYRNSVMRKMLCQADLLITPSLFLKRKFVEFGIPEEKIRFSEYGMNAKPYENIQPHRWERPIRFGFLGTIVPHKGVHIAVDVFKKLDPSEARLDIYGQTVEGKVENYAEDLEKSAGPNVHFHGAVDNDQIAEVLSRIDVLIVPSTWHETFCIVVREAMMAGVPSIASNVGAIPQVMEDGRTGMLFEPGNADDLLSKVRKIIADPDQINRFRANMPSSFKTIDDNARELEEIYSDLVEKKSASVLKKSSEPGYSSEVE